MMTYFPVFYDEEKRVILSPGRQFDVVDSFSGILLDTEVNVGDVL